ncbi:MAG: glutamate--tRNA ligase [Francisellaceae bacterium]|nr:glutamate--tRNA ligase [Francisellaceae bacterium]
MKARFAPSPTGLLHYGNIRTALFNYLLARKQTGEFVLRVEDTDLSRSKDEYIDALKDDLIWLGMEWTDIYRQSERSSLYDKYFSDLESNGDAYPCFCSPEQLALSRRAQLASGKPPRYSGTCKSLSKDEIDKKIAQGLKPTLRFIVGNDEIIEFEDLIKGPQKFCGHDIGDFIVRRADGSAAFMFCNAVDDADMSMTHALRGEDHLTNTPRQILILKKLNLLAPKYGHFPLIIGEDRSPLSKRNGSETIISLREQGYMPEAVINYLARLGHTSYPNTLMSMDELAEQFDLTSISRSPARHDKSHLLHWQKEYILSLTTDEFKELLLPKLDSGYTRISEFASMIQPNILYINDVNTWVNSLYEGDFIITDNELVVVQEAGMSFFEIAVKSAGLSYKDFIDGMKEQLGVKGKKLFMPVRVALTGYQHGPKLEQIFTFLGQEELKKRFAAALKLIGL